MQLDKKLKYKDEAIKQIQEIQYEQDSQLHKGKINLNIVEENDQEQNDLNNNKSNFNQELRNDMDSQQDDNKQIQNSQKNQQFQEKSNMENIQQFIKENYNQFTQYNPSSYCFQEAVKYNLQFKKFQKKEVKNLYLCPNKLYPFWATFTNYEISIFFQDFDELISQIYFEYSQIIQIQFSNNNLFVITDNSILSVFDFTVQNQQNQFNLINEINIQSCYENIIISPSELYIALVDTNNDQILILDMFNNFQIYKEISDQEITLLAFSRDNNQIAIVNSDNFITIHDIETFKIIVQLTQDSEILNLSFSDDSQFLQSSRQDGVISIFLKEKNYKLKHQIQESYQPLIYSQFSNCSKKLLSASKDGYIYIYSSEINFQIIQKINCDFNIVKCSFSTKCNQVICLGDDQTIKFFDIEIKFNEKRKIKNLFQDIKIIEFCNQYIGIVFQNNVVRIYDLNNILSDDQYIELENDYQMINSISFQYEGKYLAISNDKNIVFIYDIELKQNKFQRQFINKILKIQFWGQQSFILIGKENGKFDLYEINQNFQKILNFNFFKRLRYFQLLKIEQQEDQILCQFEDNSIIRTDLFFQNKTIILCDDIKQSYVNKEQLRAYTKCGLYMAKKTSQKIAFFILQDDQYYFYQTINDIHQINNMVFSKCNKYFATSDSLGFIKIYSIIDNFNLIIQQSFKQEISGLYFFVQNEQLQLFCATKQQTAIILNIDKYQYQQIFKYFIIFNYIQQLIKKNSSLSEVEKEYIQRVLRFKALFQINFIYFISYMEVQEIREQILKFLTYHCIFVPFQKDDYMIFYDQYISDKSIKSVNKKKKIKLYNLENKQFLIDYITRLKDSFIFKDQIQFLSVFLKSNIKLQLNVQHLLDSMIINYHQQDYKMNENQYHYFYSQSKFLDKQIVKQINQKFLQSGQGTFMKCQIFQIKYAQSTIKNHEDLLTNDIYQLIEANYVGEQQPIYKSIILQHMINNGWFEFGKRIYTYEGLLHLCIFLIDNLNYLFLMGEDIQSQFKNQNLNRVYIHILNLLFFLLCIVRIMNELLEIIVNISYYKGKDKIKNVFNAIYKHFQKFFNIFEIICYTSSLIVIFTYSYYCLQLANDPNYYSLRTIQILQTFMTIGISMQGASLLKYLRINNKFTYLLLTMRAIILDLKQILFIFIIIKLLVFMAYYIIQFQTFDYKNVYLKYELIKQIYNLFLGNYSNLLKGLIDKNLARKFLKLGTNIFDVGSQQGILCEFYFISSSMLFHIILFNLIVAIMGQSYNKVHDLRNSSQLYERLEIMTEQIRKIQYLQQLFGFKQTINDNQNLYLNIILPSNQSHLNMFQNQDNEGQSYIKTLDDLLKQQSKIQKKINLLQIQIEKLILELTTNFDTFIQEQQKKQKKFHAEKKRIILAQQLLNNSIDQFKKQDINIQKFQNQVKKLSHIHLQITEKINVMKN